MGGLRHRTGGFLFATEGRDEPPGQTLEAAIMDWADDITYAVHDLEDFYRAGLTPIVRLHNDDLEKDLFIARSTTSLQKYERFKPEVAARAFEAALDLVPLSVRIRGQATTAGSCMKRARTSSREQPPSLAHEIPGNSAVHRRRS